jgi:hypothetical protein
MSELPLIPVMTKQSGKYSLTLEGGLEWQYEYTLSAMGTRSERRTGRLGTMAVELGKAQPGDRISTPWGIMQLSASEYERGWLLEKTYGRPIDNSQGQLLEVPAKALERAGRWTGHVDDWVYSVVASAMGTRSERRIGRLSHGRMRIEGKKEGEVVDTPWGRMHWMGPVNVEATTDYEQGFLLRGTMDRTIEEGAGGVILPTETTECHLESLYLDGVKLQERLAPTHAISLKLSGRPDREATLKGTLKIDPNTCQLNVFGDGDNCSEMAAKVFEVSVTLQRLADPHGLHRRFFAVHGGELTEPLALIVQGHMERCYLKARDHLIPLFLPSPEH